MLFGADIVWGLMVMACTFGWIIGMGALAVFILKFKPTRRFINKFIDFELY